MTFKNNNTVHLGMLIAQLQEAYESLGDVPVLVEADLAMVPIKTVSTVTAMSRPVRQTGETLTISFVAISNRDPQVEGPPLPNGAVKATLFTPMSDVDSTPFSKEVNEYLDNWTNGMEKKYEQDGNL